MVAWLDVSAALGGRIVGVIALDVRAALASLALASIALPSLAFGACSATVLVWPLVVLTLAGLTLTRLGLARQILVFWIALPRRDLLALAGLRVRLLALFHGVSPSDAHRRMSTPLRSRRQCECPGAIRVCVGELRVNRTAADALQQRVEAGARREVGLHVVDLNRAAKIDPRVNLGKEAGIGVAQPT